jgi:hypothetical protein
MIELDKLLDYDCVEEIVLLFVQIIYFFLLKKLKKTHIF